MVAQNVTPVLWRARQAICEFTASLVYIVSSRPADPISKYIFPWVKRGCQQKSLRSSNLNLFILNYFGNTKINQPIAKAKQF